MKREIKIMIQGRFNDLTENDNFTADKILHLMYGYFLALFDSEIIRHEELVIATRKLCDWRMEHEER